jgi:hypothetical protein
VMSRAGEIELGCGRGDGGFEFEIVDCGLWTVDWRRRYWKYPCLDL